MVRTGLEPATSRFQVRRPNRSATLRPPTVASSSSSSYNSDHCLYIPCPIELIHSFTGVNLILYSVFLECNQTNCLLARAPHSCCWTGTRAKCWRHRVCVNWLFCQVHVNSLKSSTLHSWELERRPPLTSVLSVAHSRLFICYESYLVQALVIVLVLYSWSNTLLWQCLHPSRSKHFSFQRTTLLYAQSELARLVLVVDSDESCSERLNLLGSENLWEPK